MRTLGAGLLYFSLVFGTGFVLGPIRILALEPRIGVRSAELIEMPVMFAVMILAARWVVRRMSVPAAPASRLGMGLVALALMLAAEFGVVLRLRGMSFDDYLATRDPVSGTLYYLMLGVLAVLPLLADRRR